MPELIGQIAQIRDGLTLIAFLSLVLLLALRTKRVPELFFGLVRDKLTRAQFSALLNRFMLLTFIAFLALVSLAVLSQVLAHLTQPGALTVTDLRRELTSMQGAQDQKDHAEAQFNLAMQQLAQRNYDAAIASLQSSIQTIPTLTAQQTLADLYRTKGDLADASTAWEGAVKIARQRNDVLALARLQNDSTPQTGVGEPGEHDLIGASLALPRGGDRFETAPPLAPGFYNCAGHDCTFWYKIGVRAGQTIHVKFRSPPDTGGAAIEITDTNGQHLTSGGGWPTPVNTIYDVRSLAMASGTYFLHIDAYHGAVFRVTVA